MYRRLFSSALILYLFLRIFVAQTTANSALDSSTMVMVDGWWVSKSRCDVHSVQNVGFHAIWAGNGSSVQGGTIYVNGQAYTTNASGWIGFSHSSPNVGRETWMITAVNASGITSFSTLAENPSIVWDRIVIHDGGASADRSEIGREQTVWFKAQYEYDSETFNSTNGVLYLNRSAMTWSATNNRWEYNHVLSEAGERAFQISGFADWQYGLSVVNDAVGPISVSWTELPSTAPWMHWWLWTIVGGVAASIGIAYIIRKKKPKRP